MSYKTLTVGILSSVLFIAGCQQETSNTEESETGSVESAVSLESNTEQVSYLLGFNAAVQLVDSGIDVNESAFQLGASDALASAASRLTDEQAEAAFTILQEEMSARAEAQYREILEQNAARSAAFLAENATAEGVETTESGLQYKVVEAGNGPTPDATSVVQVHYEGTTIDGNVFDSSYARGAPVEFALNQVIAGWTEGLQLMPEGSTYMLYIPSELAYGDTGAAGGAIGPNEALIFTVELLQANYEEPTE